MFPERTQSENFSSLIPSTSSHQTHPKGREMAGSCPNRYVIPLFCHSTSQETASKPAVIGNCCGGIFRFRVNQSKLVPKSKTLVFLLFPFAIPSRGMQLLYTLHTFPIKMTNATILYLL
ncbi:hypothetical protein L2E82_42367 [Cichorium intybus]|uniref:Uncharacterized protein n=1 Tax=Cichorium intybus TaxID=13427 RepID=A0ACB8ZMD3_CICIN|nr:hypothetical protein L2E82_42367 [Cichorium intybus]